MPRTTKSLFLVLTIAFLVSGASAQIVEGWHKKPVFTINCSKDAVMEGEIVNLMASPKTKLDANQLSNATYNWSVSAGSIASGQGTQAIEIDTRGAGDAITAQVYIMGVFYEQIEANCTISIIRKPVAALFSEFQFTSPNIGYVKMHFFGFSVELQNNPAAQGYVFIYPKTLREGAAIEKIIRNYAKTIGFDSSRITFVRGEKNSKSTIQFYVVPPGADTPVAALETRIEKTK